MIVVNLKGGLGNQMFQYAAGRSLSLHLGKSLLLDRSFYCHNGNRQYELNILNINENYIESPKNILKRFWVNRNNQLLCNLANQFLPEYSVKLIIDEEMGYDSNIFSNAGIIRLAGYWQCDSYFQSIANTIRNEFSFKYAPSLTNSRMIEHINNFEDSVCVHIRRGDYLSTPQNRLIYNCCGLEYYKKAISTMAERLNNPMWFIFTDDPEWAQEHLSFCQPSKIINHNLGQQNYEDLRLMKHCKNFIIANSSFSWWAAWLAKNQKKIVIAPRRWYADNQNRSPDIVPDSWVRL